MTKLRGYIPTMLMLVTLMFGATAANAGIIVGGRASADSDKTNPCEETKDDSLSGILTELVGFAKSGIIVGGRLGIIVGGRTSDQDTCGIIVGGRTGIIVGG
jgi:hypothetical protein